MSSSGEESEEEEDLDQDIFHTDLSGGGTSSVDAAAAAEKEEEDKYLNDPVFLEKILRDRLQRRTDLINEMRKAYLRDIISIKSFLGEFCLTTEERKELFYQWKSSVPTIDLRQHFMLYSPHETSLNMLPCEACGGSVEIVHHESSEIEALSKALSHTDKTKHDLKVVIATKTSQLESLEKKWEMESRKHRDEKKVLCREIKETKLRLEELRVECEESSSLLSKTKAENNELARASREALETRERLRQTLLELDRSRAEMKHVEEEMASLQIHRGMEANKLIAMTKNRDHLEGKLATALAEKEAEVKENLRLKGNYEAIQKREVRLQSQMDLIRREVEDLQMSNRDLKAELSGIHSAHSMEIENLEKLCDSLREEHEVMNSSLEGAQSHLTEALQAQEEAEAGYSRLQRIYQTFKADNEKELSSLKSLLASQSSKVAELSGQLKEYEEKLKRAHGELKEKAAQADQQRAEVKKHVSAGEELKKNVAELEKQLEKAQTKVRMLERQLAQKREEEKKLQSDAAAAVAALSAAEAKLEAAAAGGGAEGDWDWEIDSDPGDSDLAGSVGPSPAPSPAPATPAAAAKRGSHSSGSSSATSTPTAAGKYTPVPRQRVKPSKITSQKGSTTPVKDRPSPASPSPSPAPLLAEDTAARDPPSEENSEPLAAADPLPLLDPPSVGSSSRASSPGQEEVVPFAPKRLKTIKFSAAPKPSGAAAAISSSLPVLRRAESDLEREDREEREKEDALVVSTSYGLQNLPQSKRLQALSGLKEGEVIPMDNPNELIGRTTAILMEKEREDHKRESWIKKYLEYFQETVKKNRRFSGLKRKSVHHLSPLALPQEPPQEGAIIHPPSVLATQPSLPSPTSVPPAQEQKRDEDEARDGDGKESKSPAEEGKEKTTAAAAAEARSASTISEAEEEEGEDLDWAEESDAIEREMGVEVAKVWGLLMSGISDSLATRLPEDEIGKLLKCLSSVTIEFAASLAKATMGMWRGIMIAKGTADLLCNVRHIIAIARPHYGFASDPSLLENVRGEFKSPSLFTAESHLWRTAYSLDPTVLRAVEKEEREMTSLQHITERRLGGDICFFGDDPKIRPFQYDLALSSLIQMKDYVDSMQLPTQISLRQLCNDWATTKINALDAEKGDRALAASLRSQVKELEEGRREWESKARGMEGEMRRVNEFKQQAVEMRKREKQWRDRAEETRHEKERLAEDLQEIKKTYEATETELRVSAQRLQSQEQRLELLASHVASGDSAKAQLEELRVKRESAVEGSAQTHEIFFADQGVQTDFFVPPMSLKHAVRPPSRSGHPSLAHSASASASLAASAASASSRPSTSFPSVTPQLDTASLYSVPLSDFSSPLPLHRHGGYDHPVLSPAPSSASAHSVPSAIFFGRSQGDLEDSHAGGGGDDMSLVSSVWSYLEFDDFNDMRDPLHIAANVSRGGYEGPSRPGTDSRKLRRDRRAAPRHARSSPATPASASAPTAFLSPVRVPSARRSRPLSPSGSSLRPQRAVDAMSSQSLPSAQSVEELLQAYRGTTSQPHSNNRKWLPSS